MELVLIVLLALNVLVFFVPTIIDFSGGNGSSYESFIRLGWNSARDIREGEFYRLLTSTFLHADIFHLAVNMYSLLMIGDDVLSIFGLPGFVIIYLVSGIGGSLTSSVFNPKIPSVGASGAIFGLVGSLLTFSIIAQAWGLLSNIVIIILLNLAIGYSNRGRIDNFGHIGGLVAGIITAVLVIFLNPFLM
jgi:rhomboid protease GluP